MNNLNNSIGNFVKSSMTIFGKDVNSNRQLPLIFDGLKPVYRRAIYQELSQGSKMSKVSTIAGNMIATTHPHGSRSCELPISNLVRWGISEGQGNHGYKTIIGDDIEPSAGRYIEARVSDKYLRLFSEFMSYVPYQESELDGNYEPKFLPTPIPLCLTFGSLGLGLGVNSRIPAFTAASLIEALKEDNPHKLRSPYGLSIIDNESELDSLWNTGIGKVAYTYQVEEGWSGGGKGTYISGRAELFKPRMNLFSKLLADEKIYIIDETDSEGSKLFVGRNYNIKSVSYDYITELAIEASRNIKTYRLTVSDGETAFLIPLKYWLKYTYDNYINTVSLQLSDSISKLEFDRQVFTALPSVVELLYNNRDYDAINISEKLDLPIKVVSAILQKSIGTLRNLDSTDKLTKISNELIRLKNITPEQKANELINEF